MHLFVSLKWCHWCWTCCNLSKGTIRVAPFTMFMQRHYTKQQPLFVVIWVWNNMKLSRRQIFYFLSNFFKSKTKKGISQKICHWAKCLTSKLHWRACPCCQSALKAFLDQSVCWKESNQALKNHRIRSYITMLLSLFLFFKCLFGI